jgi:hypothetical protein
MSEYLYNNSICMFFDVITTCELNNMFMNNPEWEGLKKNIIISKLRITSKINFIPLAIERIIIDVIDFTNLVNVEYDDYFSTQEFYYIVNMHFKSDKFFNKKMNKYTGLEIKNNEPIIKLLKIIFTKIPFNMKIKNANNERINL